MTGPASAPFANDNQGGEDRGEGPVQNRKPWHAPVVNILDGRSALTGFGATTDAMVSIRTGS